MFFALSLLMEMLWILPLHLYWNYDPLMKASIFNVVMSQNQILIIIPLLHFAGNSNYGPNEPNSTDCTKFVQKLNILFINLKIENCFCGRVDFFSSSIQKRSHYGITIYERSGYLRNSYVYLQSKKYFLIKKSYGKTAKKEYCCSVKVTELGL